MTRTVAIWAGGMLAATSLGTGAFAEMPAPTPVPAVLRAPSTDALFPIPPSIQSGRMAVDVPKELRMRTIVIPHHSTDPVPPFVSREMTGSTGAPHEPSGEAGAEQKGPSGAEGGAGHGAGEGTEVAQPAGPPPSRSPMPFDIIRTLQFLQDQIARGNGRAIRIQALMLRRFGPVFADADHATWADARNRRAAILFALSGGPPDVLRKLLADEIFDDTTKPIAEAALHYVLNDLKGAEQRLANLDFDKIEPGLAAHLSLVLGQLQQDTKPAEAVTNLDRARLLAPGGLVEEAALRLEVVLVDKLGDRERADRLARQYFDRYSRSSYVGNFQARFAMVWTDRGDLDPHAALATVMDVTARLDDSNKRALLLAISRRSLVAGHLELARLSGEEALKIQGTEGEDRQRGSLYAVAAGLAAADPAGAADGLQAIDRSQLHPADVDLLNAATSVLTGMESPAPSAPSTIAAADVEPSPVLDRAQKLLDAVAGDLGEK